MEKNDLRLTYCRYFKGEKENPFDDQAKKLMWDYERIWFEKQSNKAPDLPDLVSEYISYGLSSFEEFDDTPISLKAFLWNRYSHWNGSDAEGFKKWYTEEYKNAGH